MELLSFDISFLKSKRVSLGEKKYLSMENFTALSVRTNVLRKNVTL